MKYLNKLFGLIQIMVALCQTNVLASEDKATSSLALADFSIKLLSTESSEIGDHMSTLKIVTRMHMDDYLLKRISTEGKYEYDYITLTTTAFSTDGQKKRLRKLLSKDYVSIITYKGSISFKTKNVPETVDIQQLQKEAFIGQAKLDFLSNIHAVSNAGDYLRSIKDVFFSFESVVPAEDTDLIVEIEDEHDLTTTIIVGLAIGVSSVLCFVTFYWLWSRRKAKQFYACEGEPPSTVADKTISKDLRVDIPELQAASTGSLSCSPEDSSMGSSKFTYNNFHSDGRYSVSLNTKQTETKSFNSAGTIDLSQVDVNAWRKNHVVDEDPFEADVTKISQFSPNKTMEMEGDTKSDKRAAEKFQPDPHHFEVLFNDTKRQSGNAYLSVDNLNQFDENRTSTGFVAHSARYQERVKGRLPHTLSRGASIQSRQTYR